MRRCDRHGDFCCAAYECQRAETARYGGRVATPREPEPRIQLDADAPGTARGDGTTVDAGPTSEL